jgi:hypothetical protein
MATSRAYAGTVAERRPSPFLAAVIPPHWLRAGQASFSIPKMRQPVRVERRGVPKRTERRSSGIIHPRRRTSPDFAVDSHDAEIFWLAVAVLGVGLSRLGHVRIHSFRKVVPVLLYNWVNGRTAQHRQVR